MKNRLSLTTVVLLLVSTLIVGCSPDEPNTAQQEASEDVQRLANQLYSEVGTPEITNFQEYRFAKQIMELRDEEVTTYTYMVDERGNRHFVCKSVGFGLPYSTQVTNPKKRAQIDRHDSPHDPRKLPQREPNGLYMPDNVDATWVLCQNEDGGVDPVYSEPNLLVSPFRLDN